MSNKAQKCDIILVGGGSGGHFTPLVTVSEQLKRMHPMAHIAHIGQRGDPLNSIVNVPTIDSRYTISAGKFRRYNGESFFKRIIDVKTFLLNVRDFFLFIHGTYQAWRLLGKLQPAVIFMKGGYVCAPVGIAASWRKIPYVTHDSDAMVSLAHRVIAKHAKLHLTAMNPDLYNQYDRSKTTQVGVPVRSEFHKVTADDRSKARKQLGITENAKVLFVIGGGLGAMNINQSVISISKELLANSDIRVLHVTGHKLFDSVVKAYEELLDENQKNRITCVPFSDEVHILGAASDIVITRAGATNIAEFATLSLPCIVIPNPLLTGGHQLKNARALEEANAVVVVEEGNHAELLNQIHRLMHDEQLRRTLSENLHATVAGDAAEKIAVILRDIAFGGEKSDVGQGGELDEVSTQE